MGFNLVGGDDNLNAVIYARYSSHGQTEQSIAGQLHDCCAFAKHEGLTIVHEYIDRTITGRYDDRPDFQQMVSDSKKEAASGCDRMEA